MGVKKYTASPAKPPTRSDSGVEVKSESRSVREKQQPGLGVRGLVIGAFTEMLQVLPTGSEGPLLL